MGRQPAGPPIPFAVVGPGRVGRALGRRLHGSGYQLTGVVGRRRDQAEEAARWMGAPGAGSGDLAAGVRGARLIVVSVPDRAIEAVAEALARAVPADPPGGGMAFHVSGALEAAALAPLRRRGFSILSIHPLQTFPTAERGFQALPGTYFALEGESEARPWGERVVAALGGSPFWIAPGGKRLYHAAAVMACNHFAALQGAALRLAGEAGVERATALAALRPLVEQTLNAIFALGPEGALTGPVERGDAETVRRHLEAIGRAGLKEPLGEAYRALSFLAVEAAQAKGSLGEEAARRLKELLDAW